MALPIGAAAVVAGTRYFLIAVGLSLIQTWVCLVLSDRQAPPDGFTSVARKFARVDLTLGRNRARVLTKSGLPLFVMGLIAWTVVLQLLTWPELAQAMPPSPTMIFWGGVLLFACCWWSFEKVTAIQSAGGLGQSIANVVCIAVLVLLAFRTDGLFVDDRIGQAGAFYHWSPFVAPAEAMRQGGALLWDVPFGYGFLTTLVLAALPTATAWQSLYVVAAVGSALTALFLYVSLRHARRTVFGSYFAAAIAAAVVFLIPHYPPLLLPVHYYPSVGVMRYLWCYILIAVLLIERRQRPGSRLQVFVLITGSACWLFSVLWSAESAFYGSAVWIPAFALMVWRDYRSAGGIRSWGRVVLWLFLPLILFVGTVVVIAVSYRQSLGHGPDWRAYFDAALAFTGDFRARLVEAGFPLVSGPPKTLGVILLGILVFVLVAAARARTRVGLRDVPILIALAFGTWSLASYPIGIAYPNAVYRQMAFLILGFGIVLGFIVPRSIAQHNGSWVGLVKSSSIPLFTALLVTTYTNISPLQYYAHAIQTSGFHGWDVTAGLPHVDPSLQALLTEAGVRATDPILYAGGYYGDVMPVWDPAGSDHSMTVSKQWLPGPLATLTMLPADRLRTYMERYVERGDRGGWLIERRLNGSVVEQAFSLEPWLFEQIDRLYTPTRIAQNDDWQLVWYTPRLLAPNPLSLDVRFGRVPGLTADILVDGQRLTESVVPPVWGYFGPEWSNPVVEGPRCANGRGTLRIYSPSSIPVGVDVESVAEAFPAALQLTVNNGAPQEMAKRRNSNMLKARATLSQGWNVLAIELPGTSQKAAASQKLSKTCPNADSRAQAILVERVGIRLNPSAESASGP